MLAVGFIYLFIYLFIYYFVLLVILLYIEDIITLLGRRELVAVFCFGV